VTRQWPDTHWLLGKIYAGDRDVFISEAVAYGPVALWLNQNLSITDKVGLALNVQPSFYIQREYYIIHFLQDIFLDATTDADYLDRFRRLGLTHLAVQDWIGAPNYPEAANPAMYRFINTFEAAIRSLERAGMLLPLGEVDGLQGKKVRFFKIAPVPYIFKSL
jgi:hypothetical protein